MSTHFLSDKPVAHVVPDATGLKVFGEEEWKVKKHGKGNRRQWRKLHLAVDEETQEILFADITKEYEHDTKFIPEIIEKRKGIKRVVMDGVADSSQMYKLLWKEGIDLLTPPQKNARKRNEPWLKQRNNKLLEILGLGGDKETKSTWGKLTGYSKRVTIESAIARWKKLFKYDLRSRDDRNQRLEAILKSQIINKMILLEQLQA